MLSSKLVAAGGLRAKQSLKVLWAGFFKRANYTRLLLSHLTAAYNCGLGVPVERADYCWPSHRSTLRALIQATLMHCTGKFAADTGRRLRHQRACRIQFSFLCWILHTFLLKTQSPFSYLPLPLYCFLSLSFFRCAQFLHRKWSPASSAAALLFTASWALAGAQPTSKPPGKGLSVGRGKGCKYGELLCLTAWKLLPFRVQVAF